ncbi:MAG: molybdopterin-dependent oxidoreductase [Myxococcales bacterium]|nr:molybdopterin-dependent oxidoreductase [Myxococcales bacterium]
MARDDWKPTACILCECNCGIEVELGGEGGRHLVRLRGDRRHPVSRGYACEKAHRLDYYQHARDRLMTPLRRRADGEFEAIDWDTAIREVAERLGRVRDQHGGDSIFYYGGGGQANHLPGAYATATRAALGSRYRSNALAQEKTGEIWVSHRMLGAATRADFEHADVALFLGKNPWHSHSIPRARITLKELSRDPARSLIVIDPRRTETAELADIHLQVRPGTDAWLLSAMLGILSSEDLLDRAFLAKHALGLETLLAALGAIDVAGCCARAGVDEELVRRATHAIASARAFSSFEDLGVQMNKNSTLVSYLHRLLIVLTGNLGKPGTHFIPTPLVPFISGDSGRKSPVVGAPIISGLVPCNVIAEEILTDHERRYRAMIVEAANPAHSLADSQRIREALGALDTLVVIDVALTETARLADYVLPAATQYEKAEASFFNFEFPENCFQLRPRLFPPPSGPLPEAEIHARLVEALGQLTDADLEPLRAAAKRGRTAYAEALLGNVMSDRRLAGQIAVLLYRTLELPEESHEGAVLFGLALRLVMQHGASVSRAGFTGTPAEMAEAVFSAILAQPSGVVFAVDEWSDVLGRIKTESGKIELVLPDLLEELAKVLATPADALDASFPFVLSAGERRSFTANTILRDPAWRNKDADGSLRVSRTDAEALGVTSGDRLRVTTRRGSAVVPVEVTSSLQAGHISLPNGLGLNYPTDSGDSVTGVAPNELTALDERDAFVGTPWHKHVPARLERV